MLLHGLVIDSPLDLAAQPLRSDREQARPLTLLLRRGGVAPGPAGPAIAVDDPVSGRRYSVARDPVGWVVTFPDVAAVRWHDDGDVLEVVASERASDDLLSLLVTGPALASLLLVRGVPLIHASAVSWPAAPDQEVGGAVAFFGPAGSGKSSLARLLATRERPLLSDDTLRVEVTNGHVTAHRGTVRSRLRPGVAASALADEPWEPSADGRQVVRGATDAPALARLRLLLAPRLSPHFDRVRIRPLQRRQAAVLLATCWPVEGVRSPEVMSRQLALATAVVAAVEVGVVEVPWARGEERVDPALAGAVERRLVGQERS